MYINLWKNIITGCLCHFPCFKCDQAWKKSWLPAGGHTPWSTLKSHIWTNSNPCKNGFLWIKVILLLKNLGRKSHYTVPLIKYVSYSAHWVLYTEVAVQIHYWTENKSLTILFRGLPPQAGPGTHLSMELVMRRHIYFFVLLVVE
jgi:hypothetical protein